MARRNRANTRKVTSHNTKEGHMKIAKSAGAVATSLGLVVGMSGLAGAATGNIGNTGPWSNNQVTATSSKNAVLTNNNNLGAANTNAQDASSGRARVSFNTTGGSAHSGNAS